MSLIHSRAGNYSEYKNVVYPSKILPPAHLLISSIKSMGRSRVTLSLARIPGPSKRITSGWAEGITPRTCLHWQRPLNSVWESQIFKQDPFQYNDQNENSGNFDRKLFQARISKGSDDLQAAQLGCGLEQQLWQDLQPVPVQAAVRKRGQGKGKS